MLLENRENSVLSSLRELRDIEHTRVRSEQEQRLQAREDERQRIKEERRQVEAERRRREQEERMRLDDLERQRREQALRLQEAEQRARIAAQAALEQQRLAQEMELRRHELNKKRPTWLLAMVGVLVVLGGALGVWGYRTAGERERAEILAREREAEIDALETRMKEVQARLAAATTAEARAAARQQLATARQQLDDLRVEPRPRPRGSRKAGDPATRPGDGERKIEISDACRKLPLGC
jgi:trichohyalin